MTPQEIADYKQRWMSTGNNNPVRLHSDLDTQGKTWCRRTLERHQWSMKTWTNVYEHTFFFEDIRAAQNFAMEFGRFANQKADEFEIESLDPDKRSWYYDDLGNKRKKEQ